MSRKARQSEWKMWAKASVNPAIELPCFSKGLMIHDAPFCRGTQQNVWQTSGERLVGAKRYGQSFSLGLRKRSEGLPYGLPYRLPFMDFRGFRQLWKLLRKVPQKTEVPLLLAQPLARGPQFTPGFLNDLPLQSEKNRYCRTFQVNGAPMIGQESAIFRSSQTQLEDPKPEI